MAKNTRFQDPRHLSVVCSEPATPQSGEPVLFGQMPGVALTDERADGTTTIDTEGVYDLSVKGEDGAGNAAIAAGDVVYYDAAATPRINADATNGVRFGYALEAVNSGATATIPVKVGY